jgi:hypothetical protein
MSIFIKLLLLQLCELEFVYAQAAIIATAVQSNTSLCEFHMGDTEKIDKQTVFIILTTLRLNKFIANLLARTGFKEHV